MRHESLEIAALLERLGRVNASGVWQNGLNPTQRAALSYLARANRFSRAPSQVADYMAATRGTVSQTLKALAQRGLIQERRSASDRRSISYELTDAGRAALRNPTALQDALVALPPEQVAHLENAVQNLLGSLLVSRKDRSFGACTTCRHLKASGTGQSCNLMRVELDEEETTQLCHHHDDQG